jgi:hypothetical protein
MGVQTVNDAFARRQRTISAGRSAIQAAIRPGQRSIAGAAASI